METDQGLFNRGAQGLAAMEEKMEWKPGDEIAPGTEFHEIAVKNEPLESLKTEIKCSNNAPGAHWPCALIPQTNEYLEIKSEEELTVAAASDSETHNNEDLEKGDCQQAGLNTAKRSLITRMDESTKTLSKRRRRDFACDSCDKKFSSQWYYQNHLRMHTAYPFRCEVCEELFTDNGKRKEHLLRKHPSEWQLFILDSQKPSKADDENSDKNQANESSPRAGEPNDSVTCKLCHTIYSKDLFSTHLRMAHSNNKLKCAFCPKSFKSRRHLNNHLIACHKVKRGKYDCPSCEKRFPSYSSLLDHKRVHTGDGFNCQECGKNFIQKKNLSFHMLSKHSGGTQPAPSGAHTPNEAVVQPKTVPILDEGLKDDETVANSTQASPHIADEQHLSVKQNEANSNVNPKESQQPTESTYKCELCPKTFKQAYNLKIHIRKHDKQRKYVCNSCEKVFMKQVSLATHMKIHTGETYNCQVCEARFAQQGSLKMHMLFQHWVEKTQPNNPNPQTPTADAIDIEEECMDVKEECIDAKAECIDVKEECKSDEEFIDEEASADVQQFK